MEERRQLKCCKDEKVGWGPVSRLGKWVCFDFFFVDNGGKEWNIGRTAFLMSGPRPRKSFVFSYFVYLIFGG